MVDTPLELSLAEIRKYMLSNGCKVTNHALVKHFRRFLTNPDTQSESLSVRNKRMMNDDCKNNK